MKHSAPAKSTPTTRLKQRRTIAVRLCAFQRCHAALQGFDRETQLTALKAVRHLLT